MKFDLLQRIFTTILLLETLASVPQASAFIVPHQHISTYKAITRSTEIESIQRDSKNLLVPYRRNISPDTALFASGVDFFYDTLSFLFFFSPTIFVFVMMIQRSSSMDRVVDPVKNALMNISIPSIPMSRNAEDSKKKASSPSTASTVTQAITLAVDQSKDKGTPLSLPSTDTSTAAAPNISQSSEDGKKNTSSSPSSASTVTQAFTLAVDQSVDEGTSSSLPSTSTTSTSTAAATTTTTTSTVSRSSTKIEDLSKIKMTIASTLPGEKEKANRLKATEVISEAPAPTDTSTSTPAAAASEATAPSDILTNTAAVAATIAAPAVAVKIVDPTTRQVDGKRTTGQKKGFIRKLVKKIIMPWKKWSTL